MGNGQAAFDDFFNNGSVTPVTNASTRHRQTTQSVMVSPTKRRKTETSTAPHVIDLVDDDQVQEVGRPDQPVTPTLRHGHRPPPSTSAQSRRSTESRPSSKEKLPASLTPANEFLGTEAFLKIGRRLETMGHQQDLTRMSSRRSVSGSVTPQAQTAPTLPQEDKEDMAAARASRLSNSRRVILKEHRQGVHDTHIDPGNPKVVKSRHFENARINESTSDRQRPTVTQSHTASDDLRSFKRAANKDSHDDYSDDELGQDPQKAATIAPLRSSSPSKSARTANGGARRKSKAQEAAQGWPLTWARTHDFDSHMAALSEFRQDPLILRHGKDPNTLEIAMWDKHETPTNPAIINTRSVVKCQADDAGHIRLEGPRTAEGTQLIFDLEFKDMAQFSEFCDQHASSYCGQKVYKKDDQTMKLLFGKALRKIDTAKRPPLVQETSSVEASTKGTHAQTGGTAIWNQMKTSTQRALPDMSNRGLANSSEASAQVRVSTRPTRATRATAPTHDSHESDHSHQVQRFSVVHGLGTPWVKELTFGEGRQRAQVIFEDLIRLDEEEFLNDNLINFYMTYLFKESKVSPSKVHLFNTFFYNRLKQNTGREYINYEAVKRWTRDDIFTHDYIVVPINEDIHWYLAIICNVRNIARKAIEEDFDDPAPERMANASEAPTKNPPATESRPVNEPAEASDAPAPCPDSTTVRADDDANLFDEESDLNLVDPDATEATVIQLETTNVNLPSAPSARRGAIRATPSIFDSPPTSKTVLSNLHASPEKRKSKKRRSTAPKRDPIQPVVIILDSLSQTRTPAVRALKEWIAAEGKAKRGMEATIKEKGLYPKGDQIPTQSNFSDCGVYLLGYAEKFFKDPDAFTRKLLTGEMTPDEDWPQLKPKEMRINLRDIIFTMADEQQLTVPTKKKSKKSAVAENLSPAKVDVKGYEPRLPQPPLKQPNSDVEKSCVVPSQTTSTSSRPESLKAPGDPTVAKPRLGSPFSYRKAGGSAAPARPPPRVTRSASPSETKFTTPHQDHLHGRRTQPEVRIPRRASPVKESQAKVPVVQDQAGRSSTDSVRRSPKTQSASPLKRATYLIEVDEDKHGPSLIESTQSKHSSGTKASGKHTMDGQPNYPIEILDSQEKSHTTHPPSPGTQVASPEARQKASKSPHTTHVLIQEASFEEIPRFPTQVENSQSQQTDVDFVGSQLVAQLDADDAQRARAAGVQKRGPSTPSLERRQLGPDPDVMEIDSQGNDPMDIAEDAGDTGDTVIRETPEPARRSPSVTPL